MAMTENRKRMHARQVAAAENEFEIYKTFIAKEFIERFGSSYQTPKEMRDVWRQEFTFCPEHENFLIKRSKFFMLMLEDSIDNKSPCFLRTLTGKISQYLSTYICKKGVDRNVCTHQIREALFIKNKYVQSLLYNYAKEQQRIEIFRRIYQIRIDCFREQTGRYKHL